MRLFSKKYWHYHESGCGKKFTLDHVIAAGETCPKCRQPFKKIVKVTCQGCHTIYYNDVSHPVGHKGDCPIKGEPTIVTSSVTSSGILSPVGPPKPSRFSLFLAEAKLIFGLVFGAALVCLMLYVTTLPADWGNNDPVLEWQTFTSSSVSWTVTAIANLVTVFQFLGWGLVGLVLLVLIALLIHNLVAKPAAALADLEGILTGLPSSTSRGTLPPPVVNNPAIRGTLHNNYDAILKQQVIIGGLIIGMAFGGLVCYLTRQTVGEVREVLQKIIQLGTGNIIFFAIIYFSGRLFFDLDDKLATKFNLAKSVVLSVMFGTASVLTTLILPPLLGDSIFSGPVIAVQLAMNVVVDVALMFQDAVAKLCWRAIKTGSDKFQAAGQRFWGWLSYAKV